VPKTFFRTTYRFPDTDVQKSPLILEAPRKFAIFQLPLYSRFVRHSIFGKL